MPNPGGFLLSEANEVISGAWAVAAAAPTVQRRGLIVSPRRSERRNHVHSVGHGARGVVFRERWVLEDVRWLLERAPWVREDAPELARKGQPVAVEARQVTARRRGVLRGVGGVRP